MNGYGDFYIIFCFLILFKRGMMIFFDGIYVFKLLEIFNDEYNGINI